MLVSEFVFGHNDVCIVMAEHFSSVGIFQTLCKMLCVSKNFQNNRLILNILEKIKVDCRYNMDIVKMSRVTGIYEYLSRKQEKCRELYSLSLYSFFDMIPININLCNKNNASQYYREIVVSTGIFSVIKNWVVQSLHDDYDITSKEHIEIFCCTILCLYRCVISGNENKFFIYNNSDFKEVVVAAILKSYATCIISENYKLKNYVSAVIESLVIANNYNQVLHHFLGTFISVASTREKNTDFNIHYLQGIISRLIKNSPNIQKSQIMEILYSNAYLQTILLIGVKTDLKFQHTHFSICALICEILKYHNKLLPVEFVYLHNYISKLVYVQPPALILYTHILQFILKLFRQPKSVTDYDIISNCVFELCSLSNHVKTQSILIELEMIVRVLMSRLRTQIPIPAWDALSLMCVSLIPTIIKIRSLNRKCAFLETIGYSSKKVSDEYYMILLEDMVNMYTYISIESIHENKVLIKDLVTLLKIPFIRPWIMNKSKMATYIDRTCLPQIFEKIIIHYIHKNEYCPQYTEQMIILAEILFLVNSINSKFVETSLLIHFCARVIQNDQNRNPLLQTHFIHSILMKMYNNCDFENVIIDPLIITLLCCVLTKQDIRDTYKRRMTLSILWNICKSRDFANECSCKYIVIYCCNIFRSQVTITQYDMDSQLQCQRILAVLTEKNIYSRVSTIDQDREITRAVKIIRQNMKKEEKTFASSYPRYFEENSQLLVRIHNNMKRNS